MNIALFGGGSIGQRHAANARALGHTVKIFDTDETRGVHPNNGYAWNRFSETGIHAALICTPASTHESVARLLLHQLQYQGPLFVEKPLALRSDAPIFRDWPHPVGMVGYNWRFHPELAPLRSLARRGGTWRFDLKTDIRLWPGHAYADPLLECSHEIDLACAWLGVPKTMHGGSLDVGAGAWLQMQHRGEARADSVIDLRWRRDPASRTYTAHLLGGSTVLARIDTAPTAAGVASSYLCELQHFLEAARHFRWGARVAPGCSFVEGLRVVEICRRVKELAGL